ncbi:MAG TPA: hypothetical protein VF407_05105, partial [Polyangiaceae bacterium]
VTLIRYENGKTWIELTITEGRNQMIRRMGEKTGFPVMRLARTSFADISSEGLAPGKWRVLDREELLLMKKKYGVPRSIPAMTDVGVDHRSAKKGPPRSDGRGRPIQDRGPRGNKEGHGSWPKKEGADAQHEHRPPRTDRFERKGRDERPQRGSAGDRPQRGGTGDRPQRGGRGPGNERHAGVPPRGRSPHDRPQEDRGAQRGQGQRSTGRGSPASRSASWKTDEPQREGYGLGRSGRSRTTGSGGGIGAEEGDYRMRRTRRG